MDLATLRDARPNALPDAAEACEQLAGALRDQAEEWRSAVLCRTVNSGWQGAAAESCRTTLESAEHQLLSARAELLTLAATLQSGGEALRLAQARLTDALAEAAATGVAVDGEGHPDAAADDDLASRVSGALIDADTADRALAEQLAAHTRAAADGTALDYRGYAPDPLSPAVAAPDLLAAAFPPATTAPTEVAAWWRSLPADEQQHLITTRPDLIGNRDGLPATARDQANRLTLARYLTTYADRPTPADRTKLAGFQAIQARLDRSGTTPPVLLLGVSDQGQGRGILSFGNPDTATNVSAYVPGLGTELGNVGGKDGDRAFNVWKAANKADPTRGTASIVWLGYDPPPGLDKLDPASLEVMDDQRAKAGAVSYSTFMAGLRASHEGSPAHMTALGHSYGSLTVGLSGQSPGGDHADDMILIGSPGTGAEHASQLGIPTDHVWVGAAENDPVTYTPDPVGNLTGNLEERWFGRDPASADFGARRFDVADGPAHSFSAHSNYLDSSGGNSLTNIGQIVSGHADRVKTQPYR
ncbi:alpha/beta hydrolase [Kitasatospora sp. NPDC058965]|uniref:alpha/beta hydrolase n=1 Tax=Kitasatospora sp. NPDC058965 TaxID=3346682 RepID=UPI00367EEF67